MYVCMYIYIHWFLNGVDHFDPSKFLGPYVESVPGVLGKVHRDKTVPFESCWSFFYEIEGKSDDAKSAAWANGQGQSIVKQHGLLILAL